MSIAHQFGHAPDIFDEVLRAPHWHTDQLVDLGEPDDHGRCVSEADDDRVGQKIDDNAELEHADEFIARHIGPSPYEIAQMLVAIGAVSLDQLIEQTVPAAIRLTAPLALAEPQAEHVALEKLKRIAAKNRVMKSLIGMGYADTLTPKVILRNVMENPG